MYRWNDLSRLGCRIRQSLTSFDVFATDMHPRAVEFADEAADRYGLDVTIEEFPEKGTPTAEDAADAVGCRVDQIVKSLVFEVGGDGGGPVVCLTAGSNRVSEAKLAEQFGADPDEVTMASPDLVREATGWAIGGVPPLCHESEIPTLIDPALLEFGEVWAAAGTPTTVWAVDPTKLRELADATVVDVTE